MKYQNNLDVFYNVDIMKKFYQFLDFSRFNTLSLERMQEIDKLIISFKNRTNSKYNNRMSVMSYTANRLMTSSQQMGLLNGDEIAYFYIKVVDDSLLFLELATLAEDKDELRELCKRKFGVYDNVIIHMEKCLVNRLEAIELEQEENMTI